MTTEVMGTGIDTDLSTNGTNGHTKPKRQRTSVAPKAETTPELEALQTARDIANARLQAIRAQIAQLTSERDALLEALGVDGVPFETEAPAPKAPAKPRKPTTDKKTRGPRSEGIPAKVLAYVKEHPECTASEITAAIGVKPAIVHGALANLFKRGAVSSAGERAERKWTART